MAATTATASTAKRQALASNVSNTMPGAPTAVRKSDPAQSLIQSMAGEIRKVLPEHIKPDRMCRVFLTQLRKNKKLLEGALNDRMGFFGALLEAAALGIEPGQMGLGYLIPYKDKNIGPTCRFELGYKGVIELAYRTGKVQFIQAFGLKPSDHFELSYGTGGKFVYRPNLTDFDLSEQAYVYASYMRFKDATDAWWHMIRKQIEAHARQYSKSFHKADSPWNTAFDEMAKKTVLKQMLKLAQISAEIQNQLVDTAVRIEEKTGHVSRLDTSEDFYDASFEEVSQEQAALPEGSAAEETPEPAHE